MFRVIIIGGKGCGSYDVFEQKCKKILSSKVKDGIIVYTYGTLTTTHKKVEDTFNEMFCNKYHIDRQYFPYDHKAYGKDASMKRREAMLENADAAIIFDDGTKDTQHFLNDVITKGINYRFIQVNK